MVKLDSFGRPGIDIMLNDSKTVRGVHFSDGVWWLLRWWWLLGRRLVVF